MIPCAAYQNTEIIFLPTFCLKYVPLDTGIPLCFVSFYKLDCRCMSWDPCKLYIPCCFRNGGRHSKSSFFKRGNHLMLIPVLQGSSERRILFLRQFDSMDDLHQRDRAEVAWLCGNAGLPPGNVRVASVLLPQFRNHIGIEKKSHLRKTHLPRLVSWSRKLKITVILASHQIDKWFTILTGFGLWEFFF